MQQRRHSRFVKAKVVNYMLRSEDSAEQSCTWQCVLVYDWLANDSRPNGAFRVKVCARELTADMQHDVVRVVVVLCADLTLIDRLV